MAYSKLHSSIVASSLWTQPDAVRLLFITLLAMCDKDGIVYGSKTGISRLALIDMKEADDAWETLMSPDNESSDAERAPENEGRRIEKVPGGYRLLNFEYYRGLRSDDDRREQNKRAQERFRRKAVSNSKQSKPASAESKQPSSSSAHTEADTETNAEAETEALAPSAPRASRRKERMSDEDFLSYLQGIEAFKHVNVRLEYGKAQAWIAANPGRQLTHPFFQRWVSKAATDQRTMNLPPSRQAEAEGRLYPGPAKVKIIRSSELDENGNTITTTA